MGAHANRWGVSKRDLPPLVSPRESRRKLLLLRGMLVVAVGALLVQAGAADAGIGALALVLVFALSDVALAYVPARTVSALSFGLAVGLADLLLVALGMRLAGVHSGALPVSALLMILVVALGNYTFRAVAGAATVGALHAWMVVGRGSSLVAARELGLQIMFLCAIALYYGYLVQGVHRNQRRNEARRLSRRELAALLGILKAVTSSLDLRGVTQTIVRHINAVVPALRCSLLFLDPRSNRCYVMASHDDPTVDMLEIELGKYPEVRRAIETRDPVIIHDVSTDPLVSGVREVLENLDVSSLLVLPLTFGEDVLGTLFLKTARAGTKFTTEEINFCRAVADASANALKNALLHHQVREGAALHQRTLKKLENLLRHSPDLILTTDNEGKITELNRGGEKLLGYDRTELLGKPFTLLCESRRLESLPEKIRTSGALSNVACCLKKKNGTEIDVQLNISPLRDEADAVAGTVWIARDVTELRSTQTQLVQAEKLSAMGNIISGVAHELNNPLSVVLGFSQLLLGRDDGPEARKLEQIQESAQRCQKIVRNLLSFARAHKPERNYLGANGIIQKTLDLKEHQLRVNNIEVIRELDPQLPHTMLDFHQIQQVLVNLINNAQYAMTRNGEGPHRLTVRSMRSEKGIRLVIADTGEGMDAETLSRVFDPFFTTKPEGRGTGLGLSVSYGIIQEHRGRIHARSRPGAGTTFTIDLPVYGAQAQSAPEEGAVAPVAPADPGLGPRRVLLVDDEPDVLDLMIEIVRDLGHRVDTASNGEEAWRKVRDHDYDVVITDVRMPRMNGFELYRNLLSIKPEMEGSVIFTTGDLVDSETAKFVSEANARSIAKPFDVVAMQQMIEETRA